MTSARTLHAHLLDTLGLALTSGQYPSGTVLRLEELTAKYGVSRTVGREAVRVLEALRMVRSRPKIGVIVRPATDWNLFDPQLIRWRLAGPDRRELLNQLSQLRAAVEPAAAGLAATAATAEQRTELLRLAGEMRKQAVEGNTPGFVEADVAFHRLVFVASGNGLFAHVSEVTAQVLHGRAELQLMPADLRTTALDWHMLVAEAVMAGNSVEAERVSRCIALDSAAELDRLLET